MTVTFSESVTGVAATSNVVLTDKGGSSNNDGVSMTNLVSGAVNLGSSNYISGSSATSAAARCRSRPPTRSGSRSPPARAPART